MIRARALRLHGDSAREMEPFPGSEPVVRSDSKIMEGLRDVDCTRDTS
jgi:hypothetical protein